MKKYNNKKRDNVTPIETENERDENYNPDNPQIDLKRTRYNYHTAMPKGGYMKYINERIATLPLKRKVRSDAVLMCSFIIGSDGDFFQTLTSWEKQQFFEDVTEYFAEKYGRENIISAVVHMDETTPHLHLNLIPIVDNTLSAKQLFTRASLRELQTDFHEKIGKKWNLERGKEGSHAKHIDTAEFKAKTIIERAEARAKTTRANAEREASEYLAGIHEQVGGEADKPTPRKRKDAEQEIKDLRTDNAAYRIEQERAYKEIHSLFEQWRAADKRSKENESARETLLEISRAYPDEFKELLDRSRRKLNPAAYYTPAKSNHSGKDGK